MNLLKYGKLRSRLDPLMGEIDICAPEFFVQNSTMNNFYLKFFFNIMRIFGRVELQSESNFPSLYIIRFPISVSLDPLAPLVEEIDKYTCRLFCPKFNAKQFLFEAFF